MRKSRAFKPVNYAGILRKALSAEGWIDIEGPAHLTHAEFVKRLQAAAETWNLQCNASWARRGTWIMIEVTAPSVAGDSIPTTVHENVC